MNTYRPARTRHFCALVASVIGVSIPAAAVFGILELVDRMLSHCGGRVDNSWPAQLAFLALFGVIGGICVLDALVGLLFKPGRYEIGATEILMETGTFWRKTRSIRILDVGRIEITSGPLMRLFGLSDVKLIVAGEPMAVTLYGIRDAAALRSNLLERQEGLREAAEEGDLSVARTPQEMIFERLDRVLDRIERHLPPAPLSRS